MWVIDATNLRKQYGSKVAVADLSLQVAAGEVFGFLGPNGAGKTTSIKMLLGLVWPTSGHATVLGAPAGDVHTRHKIGYLPEHFRFYPWLGASEFLHLHARLLGMASAERARLVPQLLERVGLGERANTPLQAFSKGMTQRIGLAQTLLNRPQLVLLDEPTSGLDPMGRRLVRDIIAELRDQGTTVLVNSHLLSEIERICDRVSFMREGRVLEWHRLTDLAGEAVEVRLRVGEGSAELPTYLATIGTGVRFEGGFWHITLPNESIIPPLVQWLTTQQIALYELTPSRLSLEERFVQLIEHSEG